MCCDEDILNRSRRSQAQRKANLNTMKRPSTGTTKRSSLLVDYSKSKASQEELKTMDTGNLLPSPTTTKPLGAYAIPDSLSLATLVKGGRRRSEPATARRTTQDLVNDSTHSEFSLPDLDPMSILPKESQDRRQKRLGASADTLELEGDDSFCQASFSDTTFMDTSVRTAGTDPAPASRRAQLAATRQHQSLSNLNVDMGEEKKGGVLSFSLRRRSQGLTKAPLGRCKTWDNVIAEEGVDASADRFNRSLGNLNTDDLDETDHNPTTRESPGSKHQGQNRRSMLVRHSSVSALQLNQPAQPFNLVGVSPIRPTPARQNSMRVFNKKEVSPVEPQVELPVTIEIRPKSMRISRHSLRGNGSSHHEKMKRHGSSKSLGRHSLRGSQSPGSLLGGSGHQMRGSNHSSRSHHPMRRNAMPTIATDKTNEDDLMSASTQSYFAGACPSTRGAPSRRDLLKKTGSSSRRDLLAGTRTTTTSRRDLLAATRGNTSRPNLMQRQLSSRRNLGGMMTDDSSQFVTGSRIRRGVSCRQLLV